MNNDSKVMNAVFAWPLMIAMLLQGGSCRNNQMDNATTRDAARAAVEKMDRARNGMWGGKGISLQVTDAGATIEYDCAHGAIKQPLALDAHGKFDLKGEYVAESGGPERFGTPSDNKSNARPARYTGTVSGAEMTLTVTLTDTQEEVGTFTLAHGTTPRIVKCR